MSSKSVPTGGVCTTASIGIPGSSFEYVCPSTVWVWQALYSQPNCSGNQYFTRYRYASAPVCSTSPCQSVSVAGGSFGSEVTCPSIFNHDAGIARVSAVSYGTSDCSGHYPAFGFIDRGRCNLASPSGSYKAWCDSNGTVFFDTFTDSACSTLNVSRSSPGGICSFVDLFGLDGMSFSYSCGTDMLSSNAWKTSSFYDSSSNCSGRALYTESSYDPASSTCGSSTCEILANLSKTISCSSQPPFIGSNGIVYAQSFLNRTCVYENSVTTTSFQNGLCILGLSGSGSFKAGCFLDGTFYYNTYNDSACTNLNVSQTAPSHTCTTQRAAGSSGVAFFYMCDSFVVVNETTTTTTTAPGVTATTDAPISTTIPSTSTTPTTTEVSTTSASVATSTSPSSTAPFTTSTTIIATNPPSSTVIVVIFVFSDPVQAGLSSSLVSILSSLTGLPSSSFQAIISSSNQRAGSTATITITSPDASQASATIVSTLSSNAAYLTQQNSAFPSVSSARVSSSASRMAAVSLLFIVFVIALL